MESFQGPISLGFEPVELIFAEGIPSQEIFDAGAWGHAPSPFLVAASYVDLVLIFNGVPFSGRGVVRPCTAAYPTHWRRSAMELLEAGGGGSETRRRLHSRFLRTKEMGADSGSVPAGSAFCSDDCSHLGASAAMLIAGDSFDCPLRPCTARASYASRLLCVFSARTAHPGMHSAYPLVKTQCAVRPADASKEPSSLHTSHITKTDASPPRLQMSLAGPNRLPRVDLRGQIPRCRCRQLRVDSRRS